MTETAINILYTGNSDTEKLLDFGQILDCRIFQANNLDTCYVKLQERQADILVLDLDDDPKEQFALLTKIAENHLDAGIEIYLLTSAPLPAQARILALKNGVTQILQKPIDLHEFSLLIERAFGKLQNRKGLEAKITELTRNTQILGKYFSRDIRDHLLGGRLQGDDKGILTYASVFHFELKIPEEISKDLPPDDFAVFLSSLFEGVAAIVYANHGSLTKYTGDGILATFGYPVFYNNDTYNAVKCSLEIRNFMRAYNDRRPVFVTEPISYGIGISTGKFFAGNVGSKYRKEHTILGDPVDLAEKLQSWTGQASVDILIDAETCEALRPQLEVKQVKLHKVREKSEVLTLYCVLNMKADAPIATALTEAELLQTYSNKPGEVEFF